MYVSMPDIKVTVNGEQKDFVGFENKNTYKIIAQNDNTIVLETIDEKGVREIGLLKFINNNKYWIYLPNSNSAWSQIHIREYFVRIK